MPCWSCRVGRAVLVVQCWSISIWSWGNGSTVPTHGRGIVFPRVKGTSGVTGGPCRGHSLRPPAESAGGICEGGGDLARVLRHGIGAADAQLHRVTTPQQRLAGDDDSWSRPGKGSFGNPGDDLAAQALPVEGALAGDDEVGGLHQRIEADRVKHRLHPTDPMSPLSLIHISEPTRRTPISYAVFC